MSTRTDSERRARMVEHQVEALGVSDVHVLRAMRAVPRERFVSEEFSEFAYDDSPLPIEGGQTISQPFIVALMIEALDLDPGDRVLEIGAGSGYAAAVLGRIAHEVHAVERHEALAVHARKRMDELGYTNVHVHFGDGTLGWQEHAPYDAILVSAGGPEVPRSLLEQLSIGARLVIPVGTELRSQELLRFRRTGEFTYDEESLGRVQFVPLIGTEGWSVDGMPVTPRRARQPLRVGRTERRHVSALIAGSCEPFDGVGSASLGALLDRIGDARVVLIGESTHGTSEFYEMRARITRELIRERGFNVVAIEGDWPDTRTIDRYVRRHAGSYLRTPAFSRFPSWMWRNEEMRGFVDWVAGYNNEKRGDACVSVHGLDLYSLNNSIGVVLDYLDRVDPLAARAARARYACFSPWESDPATYGRAVVGGRMESCEREVVAALTGLLDRRLDYLTKDGDEFFDAARNAIVVREAERYYRAMYYGSRDAWNLRDRHMFETLGALLEHRGEASRAVVWAHNSHVGNAAATEMGIRGEVNLGQLARERFGSDAYLIGFGTDHGRMLAASNWDEPVRVMSVRASHEDSYERLCHLSGVGAFFLPLRERRGSGLRDALLHPHLERAIGVIYRPETELLSHYFQAALPAQFDEYMWIDETSELRALKTHEVKGMAETYPFGL